MALPVIDVEAEVRRLRTLYELLAVLSHARTLEDVYEAALSSLIQSTAADRAAILLFDDNGVMRFKASRGLSRKYQALVTGHSPWRQGETLAVPLTVPDVQRDESLAEYRSVFEAENIRALAFIPLALERGVFGKFMLYYSEPHECDGGELEIGRAIAAHVALATEHKRRQLAGARSEQRLQAILDNSVAIVFLKDVQGRYLLVNRRFEELFHLRKSEVLGRTDRDIFPSELADRYSSNDRDVLAAGKALTFEEYAPQDDGLHTYLSVKFPLLEADGTVSGVCGIATDITERKEAELASLSLAAIVESSQDAIIGVDPNGVITSWNYGAEAVFGYTAAEAIGEPVFILAAPDRLDEMPGILAKVLQGEIVRHYETKRRRKDGHIADVALSVSPVRDVSGRIIGVSKIARDITDRKIAEQEREILLAREQEARRTAELLNRVGPRLAAQLNREKLAQEVIDIATTLVRAEFGAFFHNAVDEKGESSLLYTVSGVSKDIFTGLPLPRNTALLPAFSAEGLIRCDDIAEDARYAGDSPFFGILKGSLAVRSYLAVPVVTRSGEVLGGLLFGHSLPGKFTETHESILTGIAAQAGTAMDNALLFEQSQRIQSELTCSNEELRRVNRDLEVFAYSASHDLQEPLRSIAMSGQLLERRIGGQLTAEDSVFLSNMTSAAMRMSSLIKDLLDYVRAAKQEEGEPSAVDANRVLADVLKDMHGPIGETGAIISSEPLPVVRVHERRLAQIFQNLISNAIKYRAQDVPRVNVTVAQRDGWRIFSVTDNGIGIEPEYAERIFGLFSRLHGRDQYPGSGIGLSICQRLVEQYGGRIWLEHSEPSKGSTFCFSVPSAG